LVALQIVAMFAPPPAGEIQTQNGISILVIYLVVVLAAALTDRHGKRGGA
jgi:hypothetical protein